MIQISRQIKESEKMEKTLQDQMEIIGETKYTYENNLDKPIEMKDIKIGDYFSTLLETASKQNSEFMNFAKKQASSAYNLFGKSYVSNLSDFAIDLANMS